MTLRLDTKKTMHYEFWAFEQTLSKNPAAVREPKTGSWGARLGARLYDLFRTRPSVLRTPVFPHPTADGGVPYGWVVRWAGKPTQGQPAAFVVERLEGGWTLLFHGHTNGVPTTVTWDGIAESVEDLYRTTVIATDLLNETPPETHVRDYALSCYDMTDETEAAEATLVGLGARVTVFPRALVRNTAD